MLTDYHGHYPLAKIRGISKEIRKPVSLEGFSTLPSPLRQLNTQRMLSHPNRSLPRPQSFPVPWHCLTTRDNERHNQWMKMVCYYVICYMPSWIWEGGCAEQNVIEDNAIFYDRFTRRTTEESISSPTPCMFISPLHYHHLICSHFWIYNTQRENWRRLPKIPRKI